MVHAIYSIKGGSVGNITGVIQELVRNTRISGPTPDLLRQNLCLASASDSGMHIPFRSTVVADFFPLQCMVGILPCQSIFSCNRVFSGLVTCPNAIASLLFLSPTDEPLECFQGAVLRGYLMIS